jgi:hypothetical protein
MRLVSSNGTVNVLRQSFKVGKRRKYEYIKATLDTKLQALKMYHRGRLVKQFAYKLSGK